MALLPRSTSAAAYQAAFTVAPPGTPRNDPQTASATTSPCVSMAAPYRPNPCPHHHALQRHSGHHRPAHQVFAYRGGHLFTQRQTTNVARLRSAIGFSLVSPKTKTLGSAEGLGDSLFSCRCCGGCVHHGFEFDRSQTSQAGLSAPTMIGPFDPGHDRTAQLVTSGPALTIENVVL